MPSGDWWWNMQEELNKVEATKGVTIVPLIVASDKTKLTLQSGDLEAHAVYLSVGNLKADTRHSNERPGSILLALLPCIKEGDAEQKSRYFHACLDVVFESVKRLLSSPEWRFRVLMAG
ncbi:unnamed protein product [Aureobasidium vineae]|uniref:Uncharacterized protein n=1 Tax=Aureobasidium vineae TaxID=2773715 RepID=A0A9N8J9J1_9PEZI|nr:unnamed protein product [Aureobasidium vineae]